MSRAPAGMLAAARASLLNAAAGTVLLFPLVAVRVDAVERTIAWRWENLGWTAAAVFALSLAWRLRESLVPRAFLARLRSPIEAFVPVQAPGSCRCGTPSCSPRSARRSSRLRATLRCVSRMLKRD